MEWKGDNGMLPMAQANQIEDHVLPQELPESPIPTFRVLYGFGRMAEFVSGDAALLFAVRLHRTSVVQRWDGRRWRAWK